MIPNTKLPWKPCAFTATILHVGLRTRGFTHTQDGLKIEETALLTLLQDCTKHKDLSSGIGVHDEIVRKGFLERSSDALVIMYAKCGALAHAKELLDMHKSRDVFTWTTLIAEFVEKGHCEDALDCFDKMRDEGITPNGVTFTCILKACGIVRTIDKGEKVHDEIAKRQLLERDVILGNSLVDMYARCGALAQARQVLEELPTRNVISWTALIAGYVQQGDGEQALCCFEWMQRDDILPNAVTFICILKACGSIKAADKGVKIHDEISKQGLLGRHVGLGSALVDMYIKCGALVKARMALKELPIRNAISWNTLIAGYAQEGEVKQALECLKSMRGEGLSPDVVTFTCILKACGSIRAIDEGNKIHGEIIKQGLLEGNVVLGNALVDMYAKCGMLTKARGVLQSLSLPDIVSWNALISGYAQQGNDEQAFNCYEQLQSEGLSPNSLTFTSLLKACASIGALDRGEMIRDKITKEGFLGKDVMLGNALINVYVKCGALPKAHGVLEDLPVRNVVSWTTLIAGYVQQGEGSQALNCFKQMLHEGLSPDAKTFICILQACGITKACNEIGEIHHRIGKEGLLGNHIILGNALVDAYVKCGALDKAQGVLEELSTRTIVTWNTLIAGYAEMGKGDQALLCFGRMQDEGVSPDEVTFICIFKACGSIGATEIGETIHDEVSKRGLLPTNVAIGNALVDMYAKCGALAKARRVLEDLPFRDVLPWKALIAGHMQLHEGVEALSCVEGMLREGLYPDAATLVDILKACGSIGAANKGGEVYTKMVKEGLLVNDTVVDTALVDMYARCGALAKARQLLEELPMRSVVSWNALIAAFAEQDEGEQAWNCFLQMQREGLMPDIVTFMCVLKACGSTGAIDKGESIHEEVAKNDLLGDNVMLGTAVVCMYIKCGALAKARRVLEELPVRDAASWNALIAGYAQHGEGAEALDCFERMQQDSLCPDAVTFACVLTACSHAGLIENAQMLFLDMGTKYSIEPELVHYTSLVDLLGRAGHLEKAIAVLERMPSSNNDIWSAVLGACQKWGDVEVGRWAFEQAIQLDKSDSAFYVLMGNIYAAAGMQKHAQGIEAMRIENKAWMKPPQSLGKIDISGNIKLPTVPC